MHIFYFYTNIILMGLTNIFFHHIFKSINIEKNLFEKYGVNMMRSLVCYYISYNSYLNYTNVWNDKCLENINFYNELKNYHYIFLSYFLYDTILLYYQVYLGIEKKIRLDLLFHHILGITVLTIIDVKKMYNLTLLIGMSEGISIVSGLKLISMDFFNKSITNAFIVYRLIYLVLIRICFVWPSLLYFYNDITLNCNKYKNERNIYLILFYLFIIINTEVKWYYSGKKELNRI